MSRAGSVAAVAVALSAFFLATLALPHQDPESSDHASDSNFDAGGTKVRNLDALGGSNLIRDVREAHRSDFVPFLSGRHFEIGPFVRQLQHRTPSIRDYADVPKRNFDEIDRTGFDNFFGKRSGYEAPKRNFDEIDRTSFDRFMKRALYEAGLYERKR